MTPKEAITTLELAIAEVEWNYPLDISIALETAIEALKKQIPRKPILDVIYPSGIEWYLCPTCNHNNIEKSDSYCHACGQALEWEAEQEAKERESND